LAEIPVRDRKRIERFVFEDIKKLNSPHEIPNFGKLTGYDNYYKIRFGNYRAGIRITARRGWGGYLSESLNAPGQLFYHSSGISMLPGFYELHQSGWSSAHDC